MPLILNKILDLAHAAIIIISLYVRNESHDFYKPIAYLIIKIFMIGILEFEISKTAFPNGFYYTTVYWGKKWVGMVKPVIQRLIFVEALHDHFEAQYF